MWPDAIVGLSESYSNFIDRIQGLLKAEAD